MADFSAKTFRVTVTGFDWNGQATRVIKTVATHGDAEQAKYVVVTQDYPVQVRTVVDWVVERIA